MRGEQEFKLVKHQYQYVAHQSVLDVVDTMEMVLRFVLLFLLLEQEPGTMLLLCPPVFHCFSSEASARTHFCSLILSTLC